MDHIFLVGSLNDLLYCHILGCIVATLEDLRMRLARKVASGMVRRQAALLFEVRSVWRKRQAWLLAHPEQIGKTVFIDETGINTKMAHLRGRYPRGQRMVTAVPHGHWKTMTFIARLRCDGLTEPQVIESAMDGDVFERYIET